MIHLRCHCGCRLRTDAPREGERLLCPRCKRPIRVAAVDLPETEEDHTLEPRLVIHRGPDRVGEQIVLGGSGKLTIGRSISSPIMLVGNEVSREHCHLVAAGDSWWVEDNGSRNGTIVNWHRVHAHPLQHGDLLKVGEYELRFLRSATEAIPPEPPRANQTAPLPPGAPESTRAIAGDAGADDESVLATAEGHGAATEDAANETLVGSAGGDGTASPAGAAGSEEAPEPSFMPTGLRRSGRRAPGLTQGKPVKPVFSGEIAAPGTGGAAVAAGGGRAAGGAVDDGPGEVAADDDDITISLPGDDAFSLTVDSASPAGPAEAGHGKRAPSKPARPAGKPRRPAPPPAPPVDDDDAPLMVDRSSEHNAALLSGAHASVGGGVSAGAAADDDDDDLDLHLDEDVPTLEAAPADDVADDEEMPILLPDTPAAAPLSEKDSYPCPSCGDRLPLTSRVCTVCGIFTHHGRPLRTDADFNRDALDVSLRPTLAVLSWLPPWVGLYPAATSIRAARSRPWVTWALMVLMVLVSVASLAMSTTGRGLGRQLAAWPMRPAEEPAAADILAYYKADASEDERRAFAMEAASILPGHEPAAGLESQGAAPSQPGAGGTDVSAAQDAAKEAVAADGSPGGAGNGTEAGDAEGSEGNTFDLLSIMQGADLPGLATDAPEDAPTTGAAPPVAPDVPTPTTPASPATPESPAATNPPDTAAPPAPPNTTETPNSPADPAAPSPVGPGKQAGSNRIDRKTFGAAETRDVFAMLKSPADDSGIQAIYRSLPPEAHPVAPFRAHQLVSHVLLHPSAVLLAVNLVFLLIIVGRINAVLGNPVTACLFVVLALLTGLIYVLLPQGGVAVPLAGAQATLLAFAGVYVVLFPADPVPLAGYVRRGVAAVMIPVTVAGLVALVMLEQSLLWMLLVVPLVVGPLYFIGGFNLSTWLLPLPGYAVLVLCVAVHIGLALVRPLHPMVLAAEGAGLLLGVVAGLALLASRKFPVSSDLLSLTLGRRAWRLVGSPYQRRRATGG